MNDTIISNDEGIEQAIPQPEAESTSETATGGDEVSIRLEETAGVIILGILAFMLLRALLRSEARNRELLGQMSSSETVIEPS